MAMMKNHERCGASTAFVGCTLLPLLPFLPFLPFFPLLPLPPQPSLMTRNINGGEEWERLRSALSACINYDYGITDPQMPCGRCGRFSLRRSPSRGAEVASSFCFASTSASSGVLGSTWKCPDVLPLRRPAVSTTDSALFCCAFRVRSTLDRFWSSALRRICIQ